MDCKIRSFNYIRAKLFGHKSTIIGELIARRSRPHIHNEFVFSERYKCVSCSATLADKANSVRFKFIQYSHEAERWDTDIVPMTDEQEDRAWAEACRMADLPLDWLDTVWPDDEACKGHNAIPYDKVGQLCHVLPFRIWIPSKDKTWCTKTVAQCVYAGRPDFKTFLQEHGLWIEELKPDELKYMSEYYFRQTV